MNINCSNEGRTKKYLKKGLFQNHPQIYKNMSQRAFGTALDRIVERPWRDPAFP